MIFTTAESAAEFVNSRSITGSSFKLALANGYTFASDTDMTGLGMAIVLDAILAQGFEPDGFDEIDDHRVYRYKPMD